ncbi:GCN5-related N-acetyltransferase (plasmid) [Gemmatirosa kalamazoonensis]|uniref:GCN5-related N-acetyltransferase n=1 Tax=Gemmatirosa kalamazoonensis TaxID=861299 RepID=W0RRF7_9BACT|nr:GNAT family N-acetyltransferase [Gemmatirosa kalamazoonensis]AHG93047.1 GCN5-related N-acetyltransferase [Gemmatirosa kalamazoonensis]
MSDAGILIRPATDGDWPAIWSIFHAVVSRGDTYTYAPDSSEADARRLWMGPGVSTFVAVDGADVVGTYVLKPNQPGLGAHVANAGYMVRPGAFGRGIGWAMGVHSLDAARSAGFRAMQFNAVVSTNDRAVALWRRLGFVVVGTIPAGFRHAVHGYVDLYVMHRFL